MAFSLVVVWVVGLHWRLVSCSSNLSMSPPHSISSLDFTTACASSRSATFFFFFLYQYSHTAYTMASLLGYVRQPKGLKTARGYLHTWKTHNPQRSTLRHSHRATYVFSRQQHTVLSLLVRLIASKYLCWLCGTLVVSICNQPTSRTWQAPHPTPLFQPRTSHLLPELSYHGLPSTRSQLFVDWQAFMCLSGGLFA